MTARHSGWYDVNSFKDAAKAHYIEEPFSQGLSVWFTLCGKRADPNNIAHSRRMSRCKVCKKALASRR